MNSSKSLGLALAMLLCSALGCSKLNAAFGEAQGSGTDNGDDNTTSQPVDPTEKTSSPSEPTDANPPANTTSGTNDATSNDSTAGDDGQTTELDDDSGDDSGGDPVNCAPSKILCNAYGGPAQCENGLVCRPQGGEGGYTETVCVQPTIPDDENDPNDPCSIECGRYGGIDDCLGHRLCDAFQTNDAERRCVDICTGNPLEPMCPAQQSCQVDYASGAAFGLCRHNCNPLEAESCGNDMVCAPRGANDGPEFVCVPTIPEAGDQGETCEGPGDCEAGLLCADCAEGLRCCSSICDATEKDPTEACEEPLQCNSFGFAGGHPLTPGEIGVCV